MKCIECSITIPELPEDAIYEEMLCNSCYKAWDMQVELEHQTYSKKKI